MNLIDFSRDPLTGVPNLIGFLEDWEKIRKCRWRVLAHDLVGYAELRDRQGAPAADRVIQALVSSLSRAGKELAGEGRYRLYRTGSDEFLLLWPHGSTPALEAVSARIAQSVFRRGYPHGPVPRGVRWSALVIPDEADTAESVLLQVQLKLRVPGLHGVHFPPDNRPGPETPRWGDPDTPAVLVDALPEVAAIGQTGSEGPDGPAPGVPPWVERLLSRVVRRFTETITLLRETQTLALTDAVSGLPNHRAAEAMVEQLMLRYQREGQRFAILFVDGDNLRAYNDIDYEAGNRMIADLGETLRQTVRAEDYVARWLSGDEFLILLPGSGREGARVVAQRILHSVAQASRSWPLPVTVSIGIAACPEDGTDSRALIRRAAVATSQAKQAGKNRVC